MVIAAPGAPLCDRKSQADDILTTEPNLQDHAWYVIMPIGAPFAGTNGAWALLFFAEIGAAIRSLNQSAVTPREQARLRGSGRKEPQCSV
jgi:hypothetical protein